jgi:hypothetical protein
MSAGNYNYAVDAVARSGSTTPQNMFATAKADNLPTAIIAAGVNVATDASATPVPIPASVFSAGSGLYHLWCNGPRTYDVCSTGNIIITPAGTVASAAGFSSQNIQSVTPSAFGTPSAIVQVTLSNTGTGPVLTQNSGGAQTYSCQAIKIAN